MDTPVSAKSEITLKEAACGLAIMTAEICDKYDVLAFEEQVHRVPARRGFALKDAICQWSGGTRLGHAIKAANEIGGDRLIVFTDEQSSDAVPKSKFEKSYMINVATYDQTVVDDKEWVRINGFSENIVDFILMTENV